MVMAYSSAAFLFSTSQGCPMLNMYAVNSCWPISWSMAATIPDVVVVFGRARPRSIPPAMLTMKKGVHGTSVFLVEWQSPSSVIYNKACRGCRLHYQLYSGCKSNERVSVIFYSPKWRISLLRPLEPRLNHFIKNVSPFTLCNWKGRETETFLWSFFLTTFISLQGVGLV